MTASPLLILCAVIGAGCLVVMTAMIALLARDVRTAARRLSELLPHGEALIQRSQEAIGRLEGLLSHAEGAMRQVRVVTARACAAASDTLDALATAKQTAATWVGEHLGSGLGNGAGSRRSRRSSRGMHG